jgi:multiple antibiotic resistance protein
MASAVLAGFVAVYAALFPVINPLGVGPIFLNMVEGCSPAVRRQLAQKIGINCFFMLVGSMLLGPQILLFFGISLPALKLAGGAVVIVIGWSLLNQKATPSDRQGEPQGITDATAHGSAFFPLTMPLTVGPGSIATSVSLVAGYVHPETFRLARDLPVVIGALLGLIALSITIYVVFREFSSIQRFLGTVGTNVLTRLFAFILMTIGVQIFLGGLEDFAGQLATSLAGVDRAVTLLK